VAFRAWRPEPAGTVQGKRRRPQQPGLCRGQVQLGDPACELSADHRIALAASYPLGRIGRPGDVAAAAVFLASAASSWITGVTLDVAGGKIMI